MISEMMQAFQPVTFLAYFIIYLVSIIIAVLTIYALYQSASKKKAWWFIGIIVFNFVAAIIYLAFFNKKGRR